MSKNAKVLPEGDIYNKPSLTPLLALSKPHDSTLKHKQRKRFRISFIVSPLYDLLMF